MMIPVKETSGTGASYGEAYDLNDPWRIEAIPAGLLEAPLEFIFAEHYRQRQAAQILSMIADGEFQSDGIERLIGFLEGDFANHVLDEELVFFPILQQHCHPEDKIDPLLEQLSTDHKRDEEICDNIVRRLKNLLSGEKLSAEDNGCFQAFAEHIRQHLVLENAVLLPIARVRMGEEVLKVVSERLKRRRT